MSNATTNHVGRRVLSGLTGLGSSQTTALQLLNSCDHQFSSVPASTGAVLPTAKLPSSLTISNADTGTLTVYPPVGGTINGSSSSVSVAAGAGIELFAADTLTWYTAAGGGSGSGTVTSVIAGTGLTGGTITTTGTIALANPSSGALGGVNSVLAVTHNWINSIATSGVPSLTQPAFTDISGALLTAQITAANVTYAKVQNVAATALLGNPTGSAAAPSEITLGSGLSFSGTTLVAAGGGSGTVTTASVVSANGFAGTVATATTTPAITITTTATGILVGNGTAIAAAADVGIGANGQLNLASIATPATQVAGDRWTDSTQLCGAEFSGSATSADCLTVYRSGLIYLQNADVSIATSGSLTMLSATNATGTVSLPAGFLNVKNRTLRIRAKGYITTPASGQGNITYIIIKLGSNVIATSGGLTLNASITTLGWVIDVDVTTKSTGASGTLDSRGAFSQSYSGGGSLTSNPTAQICNGSTAGTILPATPTVIDLTAAYALDLQIDFSAITNTFVVTNVTVEVLG